MTITSQEVLGRNSKIKIPTGFPLLLRNRLSLSCFITRTPSPNIPIFLHAPATLTTFHHFSNAPAPFCHKGLLQTMSLLPKILFLYLFASLTHPQPVAFSLNVTSSGKHPLHLQTQSGPHYKSLRAPGQFFTCIAKVFEITEISAWLFSLATHSAASPTAKTVSLGSFGN